MSSPDLVSAVIPTLNRPELLRKAVLSALSQTWSPIEVIVVIDGEDRASEEVLASIHDERLRVIPLAVNMGGAEARNIGVRAAKGDWIAFLDDDEWLPQKIALQMEAAKASPSAFSGHLLEVDCQHVGARFHQAGTHGRLPAAGERATVLSPNSARRAVHHADLHAVDAPRDHAGHPVSLRVAETPGLGLASARRA